MEIKDYLIVYGKSIDRGYPCYKESEINCNELIKYMPLIKKITDNINSTYNWNGGIIVERLENGTYIEHNKLYELYPDIDSNLLKDFNNYLPDGITHIESIKIFSGQKIKII